MATTDTRPGFRLPWSTNGADAEGNGSEPAEAAQATDTEAVAEPVTDAPADRGPRRRRGDRDDRRDRGSRRRADGRRPDAEPPSPSRRPTRSPRPPRPRPPRPPAKKPSKFLADLTRAMQATAESSRNETMERFTAEAKAATERVHAAAAEEATELRRVCRRRRQRHPRLVEGRDRPDPRGDREPRSPAARPTSSASSRSHAGTVETRIERVSARVAAFEAEVAEFYERLFAEEDPTRFAELAEQLPEPPSLELAELDAQAMIGDARRRPRPSRSPRSRPSSRPAEAEAVAEAVEAPPRSSPRRRRGRRGRGRRGRGRRGGRRAPTAPRPPRRPAPIRASRCSS